MTFPHFNRRLHLYLALGLLPWFFMYGVSSIPFAHNQYFQARDEATGLPQWTPRAERPLDMPVPDDPEQLTAFGADVLRELGLEGAGLYVARPDASQVNITSFTFWNTTRVLYSVDQKMAKVEDRRFRWDQFLTGMHARGGFRQEGIAQKSWSVVVDLVCIGMVLWIASGLYMWWGIPGHRGWGWLAILAGAGSFALFTFGL